MTAGGAPDLSLANVMRRPHWLLATSLGLGLCRPWPGTWGSAGGVILFAALQGVPPMVRLAIYVLLLAAAVAASTRTGNELGEPDHQAIVVDETLGMSLTLEAAGAVLLWPVAFVLFRLFDIWKPWPVRLAGDSLPGGWGVMADDVLAAGYAAFVLLGIGYAAGM